MPDNAACRAYGDTVAGYHKIALSRYLVDDNVDARAARQPYLRSGPLQNVSWFTTKSALDHCSDPICLQMLA
jgi:hypothetical protein